MSFLDPERKEDQAAQYLIQPIPELKASSLEAPIGAGLALAAFVLLVPSWLAHKGTGLR